jgi:hypothetical protein
VYQTEEKMVSGKLLDLKMIIMLVMMDFFSRLLRLLIRGIQLLAAGEV